MLQFNWIFVSKFHPLFLGKYMKNLDLGVNLMILVGISFQLSAWLPNLSQMHVFAMSCTKKTRLIFSYISFTFSSRGGFNATIFLENPFTTAGCCCGYGCSLERRGLRSTQRKVQRNRPNTCAEGPGPIQCTGGPWRDTHHMTDAHGMAYGWLIELDCRSLQDYILVKSSWQVGAKYIIFINFT